MENLLEIDDLRVHFQLREGLVRALDGVSLAVPAGRTVGLVGESGCGKSITARAILRVLPPQAHIVGGRIILKPRNGNDAASIDLTALRPDSRTMRRIRGADIAMIFQEPMTSFSPVHTIGNQIIETISLHQGKNQREAREMAVQMLRRVRVPLPERRIDAYPHELSGGLRQRCMIAMALACRPRLLIADEPTTALDVTVQAQILELIEQLREDLHMAVMLITHDLGIVAETADIVAVMYLGRVVEQAGVERIFEAPRHPYTRLLLDSIPRMGHRGERLPSIRGSVPDPFSVPQGCPFHPRCDRFMKGVCDVGHPPSLEPVATGHQAACFLYPECRATRERNAVAATEEAR
jgi:peptide/nickel transport system ATP-binding protein